MGSRENRTEQHHFELTVVQDGKLLPPERLAESSINAQKHSDEYTRPNLFTHLYYLQVEPRQAAYNVYSNMNSSFKGREGGAASSFSTVNFYNKQAKNKRDALVERYNAEAALEAHSLEQ